MHSEDENLRKFFRNIWFGTVEKWLQNEPTDTEIVDFINGKTDDQFKTASASSGGESHGMLTRLRRSARYFKKTFVKFEFALTSESILLKVKPIRAEETELCLSDRKTFYSKLRALLGENHIGVLTTKISRGKAISAAKAHSLSNKFLKNGHGITFAGYRFIHKARLDLLNLYGSTRSYEAGLDQRCRRCGWDRETLPHVLNHCVVGLGDGGITRRHDAILNRVVDAIPTNKDMEVRVNRRVNSEVVKGKRRPDIVAINRSAKTACIVDVTCPFDNTAAAISRAAEFKTEKYKAEADDLENEGYKVVRGAIVVGSLGSWHGKNEEIMSHLGIPREITRKMVPFLIGETIEHSKNVFWRHILQDKYTPSYNMYNQDSIYKPSQNSQC